MAVQNVFLSPKLYLIDFPFSVILLPNYFFLSLIEKDQTYDLSLWNISTITAMNIIHKAQFLFEYWYVLFSWKEE